MRNGVIAASGVLIGVVVIALSLLSSGVDQPVDGVAAPASATTAAEVPTAEQVATTTAAPTTVAAATTSTTTTATAVASCEPTLVPHVVATGWFDSITSEPLTAGPAYVGNTFYMANAVTMEFPVVGGPAYFYGTALWSSDGSTESYSVLASADSRAADPLGSPTAPEHVLIYDAGTASVGGTNSIGAAYETSDPTQAITTETDWQPAGFTATYDAAAQLLRGEVNHPDETFTFVADVVIEDRNLWPSAECYRAAIAQSVASHAP